MNRIVIFAAKQTLGHAILSLLLVFTFSLLLNQSSLGYGALTHQATIDAVWEDTLQPLLQKRFPAATEKELREARAYAYGGSIVQDLGYFHFSSRFFSDLVHYVRSGDFVLALLHEAHDANEYAFALGALAHYVGDNHGHATLNRVIPALYPELGVQHGHEVTYADDALTHLQTEFAFDVWQVARGCYASQQYHQAIGFKVSKPVLERAFQQTYGLAMKDIFLSVDVAISTYRRAVSQLLPRLIRVAWELKKSEIARRLPAATCAPVVPDTDEPREAPGRLEKLVAKLVRVVPKVGQLKALAFKLPTAEAETMLTASLNTTIEDYRALLQQTVHGALALANRDFDTGRRAQAGEYKLADETYAKLLAKLTTQRERFSSPGLREDILAFYGTAGSAMIAKLEPTEGRKAKDKSSALAVLLPLE